MNNSNLETLGTALLALANEMPEIREARLSDDGTSVEVVTAASSEAGRIPLARAAARIRELPADKLPGALQALLATVVESGAAGRNPETWEVARSRALRTMLFSAEHFNISAKRAPRPGVEIVAGVAEVAVIDRPESAEEVTQAHLDRWGVTADEVFRAARHKLAQAPKTGQWTRLQGAALWQWTGGDFYDASRAFTPGWLARSGLPGTGRMFVAVPSRDMVFAGRVRDVGPDLARIADLVRGAWKASVQPVSPVLYTLGSDEALCPLAPKGDKHAARELRHSEMSHLITGYTRQAEHLAATVAGSWLELRVAVLAGTEITATMWTGASVGDLLPRAQYVALPPSEGGDVVVSWTDFREVSGDHVQPEPGLIPERWRTVRALTVEQLVELARRSAARKPR